MVQYWTLSRPDIKAFDKAAKALILEATERGWLGTISSSGHAIMRAPDGETTMSVSRSSLNGRSGKNMRAEFDRWCRDNPAPEPEPKPKVEDPWLTCDDCQGLFMTQESLDEHVTTEHPPEGTLVIPTPLELTHPTPLLLREAGDPPLEGVPEPRDEDGIEPLVDEPETVVETEEHSPTRFECSECDLAFSSPQGLSGHIKAHAADKVCDYCGKAVRYLKSHLDREHGQVVAARKSVQTLMDDYLRLLAENRKLRGEGGEVESLRQQLAAMTAERDDLATKFAIIKEAAGL